MQNAFVEYSNTSETGCNREHDRNMANHYRVPVASTPQMLVSTKQPMRKHQLGLYLVVSPLGRRWLRLVFERQAGVAGQDAPTQRRGHGQAHIGSEIGGTCRHRLSAKRASYSCHWGNAKMNGTTVVLRSYTTRILTAQLSLAQANNRSSSQQSTFESFLFSLGGINRGRTSNTSTSLTLTRVRNQFHQSARPRLLSQQYAFRAVRTISTSCWATPRLFPKQV